MTTLRILFATWTLFCTCLALPDIHKQMTTDQLQSIFHVEDINSVPQYELIRLEHQGIKHRIRRRSIDNQQEINAKESHHVKKDLSKSPYYSELKLATEQHGGNSFSDRSLSDKIKNLDLSEIKEHNVSFSAFGEVLNLTLKPTDGLFKNGPESLRMWTVRSEPNSTQGVEYDEIQQDPSTEEHIGEVFQDEDNMAAILMRRQLQTGDLIMEGSIGHDMIIKPLPHDLSPNKDEVHHIVYKRSIDPMDQLSDFAFMEPDRLEEHNRKRRSTSPQSSSSERDDSLSSTPKKRSKRSAPYMIYPEILVIVDYDGYRLHGGDNVQVKRYFVSFWNGVDLRYRLLKGPRIRISIAGIIISRGRDATPYLERNRVGRDAIDSAAALTDMGKYLFRERRLPVYDIAVAITKYDMCRRRKGGRCTKGTAGFAYVGGACVVNKRLEKVNSVAIIEDTGGFSGIIVAAHEVGHLLGAVHDGSPPPSYLGGPGAEKCRWEDGYIMSDLRHTERGFRWSPCTIQSFHHFLNGDTATCLHNAPHEDNALGRALPGTLLSLDAQCRRDRGTYACFKDDRVCAQLFCFDAQTGYCVAYRPAAEGSSCGNGLHCLDGRCVAHHSNVIPDYSHRHTHSYRPVYRDDDDDDDDLDEPTTKSATTTTTTTSTTTQPTPTDYENSHNIDNNPSSTEKTQDSLEKTSFDDPSNDISSTTTQPSSSVNPPYNGFIKYTGKPLSSFNGKSLAKFSSGSTRKPFDFQNLSHKNKHKNNNSNSPYTLSSLSDRLEQSTTASTAEGEASDENNSNGQETTTTRSYILGGRSTSRSPFIESYLKKLSSTRSPYNLENIAQYFRRSTSQPSYSSNILGDNSNNSPVNVSITE